MTDERLCGPWEGSANRFVPQDFALACRIHDEDYTRNPADLSRREADRRFLANMLGLAEGPLHVVMAYAFFAAVRLAGWRYWRGA